MTPSNLLKIYPLIPASPDKYIIEQRKDQFWPARFGHINYLINKLNNTFGIIRIPLAEAQQLMQSNEVIMGATYYVTDAPNTDEGFFTIGTSDNTFDNEGIAGYYVPAYNTANPDFSGVEAESGIPFVTYLGTWNMADGSYVVGQVVTYDQYNWVCIDNANLPVPSPLPYSSAGQASRPFVGSTKWQRLPKQTNCGYFLEWDKIGYILNPTTPPTYQYRADKRGNVIYRIENLATFKWGCPGVRQIFCDSTSFIHNRNAHRGFTGAANDADQLAITMINDSNVGWATGDNEFASRLFRLTLDNGRIRNTQFCVIFRLTMVRSFMEDIKGVATELVIGGYNTLIGSTLKNFTNVTAFLFRYNTFINTILENVVFDSSWVSPVGQITNSFQYNTFQDITLNFNNNYKFTKNGFFYGGNLVDVEYSTISRSLNTLTGFLDITDPAIYNGGTKTLTIPAGFAGCGELWLYNSTGVEEITTVAGLNNLTRYVDGIKFRIANTVGTTGGVTFKVTTPIPGTPPATLVGSGDGVLNGPAYPAEYVMVANNGGVVYIKDKVSFV